MTEFSIVAVFFVGLLGGVHCLGMCGSVVAHMKRSVMRGGG